MTADSTRATCRPNRQDAESCRPPQKSPRRGRHAAAHRRPGPLLGPTGVPGGLAPPDGRNSGLALEAFYVLTGYTRRPYLVVTAFGVAAWIAQSFLGITVLTAALTTSPWIGAAAILIPVGTLAILVMRQRRRTEREVPHDQPRTNITAHK